MAENGDRSVAENLTLNTDIPTLTRVPWCFPALFNVQFIIQEQQKIGAAASGDLTILLNAYGFHFLEQADSDRLQLTCKFIAHNIRRATLINLLGLAGASNATGDDQKKLDVLGNQIFLDTMKNCGKVSVIVREEEDDLSVIKGRVGKYAVVCDPIDGSLSLP